MSARSRALIPLSAEQQAAMHERIFDRLSEAGVDDAETTEQYRDWRRADG